MLLGFERPYSPRDKAFTPQFGRKLRRNFLGVKNGVDLNKSQSYEAKMRHF